MVGDYQLNSVHGKTGERVTMDSEKPMRLSGSAARQDTVDSHGSAL
jgi:hypothetical protein